MVLVASTMRDLGSKAPDFRLPDPEGLIVTRDDFKDAPVFLVIFMCNHCPYVKHVQKKLASLVREFQALGVAVVGINSNDIQAHPEDSPEMMRQEIRDIGYTFTYLFDESQEVAKTFGAACTPDFFLFDRDRRLVYRGQMDDSRPGNNLPVTGNDLRAAVEAVLAGQSVQIEQKPSAGCNIKWKPGNAPAYFNQ